MKIQQIFKTLNNNRYLWPLKIAVTVIVIYLVDKSLGKNQLPGLLHQVVLGPLIGSLLLGCLGLYIQTRRWQLLLSNQGTRINFQTGIRTMLWGCLLAFVTPGRSGEFFRGFSINPENKAGPVYAVVIEKIYASGTAVIAGAIGALYSLRTCGALSLAQRSIIICCSVVLAAVPGIFIVRRISHFSFHSAAPKIVPGFPFENFTKKALTPIILLSIAAHLVLLIQTSVLLDMFGSHGVVTNIAAAAQAYAFMLFFPIFIANMGIREYAFSLFLGQLCMACGVSGIALGASLGILCINIILPALAGLVWWVVGKKKLLHFDSSGAREHRNGF
jgi:Uncharacterised protein family (UPF0104).